jgi:7,8-dihydropterin-6-yl-methyl-4-(beta-D-ribofuranosyl)aminobenzene 5'-phosphate synthase
MIRRRDALGLLAASGLAAATPARASERLSALSVTILDTNVAGDLDKGDGEWGFAALVETSGGRILYDTGSSQRRTLENARALGVDLSTTPDVILSHCHGDHTAGLVTLRRELSAINPKAIGTAHVSARAFDTRYHGKTPTAWNDLADARKDYEALGGRFVEHGAPTALASGVTFSGPVPRRFPERNYGLGSYFLNGDAHIEDNVPEDAALYMDTDKGVVILTGCGHAGVINICEQAAALHPGRPLHALIGGIHLFTASDETIAWTGEQLKRLGVQNLLLGHCTGMEATFRLRQALGYSRKEIAVATVGSRFTLSGGIAAGALAH